MSMKPAPIETNLLKIFRFFLIVQWVLLLANVMAHSSHAYLQGNPWLTLLVGSLFIFLLWGYLSWPRLEKTLAGFYLPIAILSSSAFSLIIQNVFLDIRLSAAKGSSEETAWTLFLFLFIPLVLTGWQYNFKTVVAFCLLTTLFDAWLSLSLHPEYLNESPYFRLLFIRAISFLIAGYIVTSIMRQFREQRTALQKANTELAHYAAALEQLAVSQERNRLARELHDTLAHTLSGMAVQLEAVQSLWDTSPEEARAMLTKSLSTTRSGLTETRRALQALRASPLDDLGLLLALRTLAETTAARAGLQLDWNLPENLPKLSPDVEQGLYRIAQEAFQNITRHANAQRLRVDWSEQNGSAALTLSDDGCGFSVSGVDGDQHFGLRGMQERAAMLGADLQITSQPGRGTSVKISLNV